MLKGIALSCFMFVNSNWSENDMKIIAFQCLSLILPPFYQQHCIAYLYLEESIV